MGRKILLVEQDPTLREVLSEILSMEGFELLAADGIDDAEALARTASISAILANLGVSPSLATMSVPLAHLQNTARDVPIVLCSVHPRISTANYERYGVSAIITMPFEIDELLHVLGQVLD
jgi:two-component system, NtrC family, nitrogen regulation response regulator NtrX